MRADLQPAPLAALFLDMGKTLASHEETMRRMLILVALYAIPVVAATNPIIDADLWWHFRTGQWIVEHGMVPQTDPFSIYGMGRPWIAYSWFFEVLIYGLYRWFGLTGILFYRVLVFLAIGVALHRFVAKREPRFAVTTGIVGLALLAMGPALTARPWLLTILFYTLTLDVVCDLRDGTRTKAIWLLPPMYALWANVHIQFIYGLFVLALACAAPLADRFLGRCVSNDQATTAGSKGWWHLMALLAACCVATMLNPYHLRIYGVVVEYAMQAGPYQYVQELTAADFRVPSDWAVLAFTGAAAFVLGRGSKRSTFELLLLAITAYFSFRARRDGWFVVIAAVAIIITNRWTAVKPDRFVLTKLQGFLVAGMVIGVLVVVGHIRNISEPTLEAIVTEKYPVAAAAVVEERGYPGPLYNHFNWGGYLIWRLPGLPVAMDGRTNLHGDERIERSLDTWAGKNGWSSDPELNAARLVIAGVDWPLTSLLRLDPRFELVYEDTVAAIFLGRPQLAAH